jgi:hypothetical protein
MVWLMAGLAAVAALTGMASVPRRLVADHARH